MRVGVVPLGYADGIPRALSNSGAFAVAGKRCPVAGRVCMNMTILDLGSTNARPGDRVVLIGNDGNASVSADDWADWAGTINYEIVARLPAGLTRTYED
jgi:alanine racemase